MKKLVSIILGLALLVLCGCGGQPSSVTQKPELTWDDTLPCYFRMGEMEVELSALYIVEEKTDKGYNTDVYAELIFPEGTDNTDIYFALVDDIKQLNLTWYSSQDNTETKNDLLEILQEDEMYYQNENKVMVYNYCVQYEGRNPLCSGEKIEIYVLTDKDSQTKYMTVTDEMIRSKDAIKDYLEEWHLKF